LLKELNRCMLCVQLAWMSSWHSRQYASFCSTAAGMKLPVEVRASDGKKYCSPDAGPATFHARGSCICTISIAPAKTVATAAHESPTFHRIRRPASRCSTNSQIAASGPSTCSQYAADLASGWLISNRTPNTSTRVSTSPVASTASATANSAYPARMARRFGRFRAFRMCSSPNTTTGPRIDRPSTRCTRNIRR
jgi:hypothetical protein